MKNPMTRWAAHARLACRRLAGKPAPDASAGEEMHGGALVGAPVCAAVAALLSGSPAFLLWGAASGAVLGALIGLLLWLGGDGPPEDPVVPPARGQARRH